MLPSPHPLDRPSCADVADTIVQDSTSPFSALFSLVDYGFVSVSVKRNSLIFEAHIFTPLVRAFIRNYKVVKLAPRQVLALAELSSRRDTGRAVAVHHKYNLGGTWYSRTQSESVPADSNRDEHCVSPSRAAEFMMHLLLPRDRRSDLIGCTEQYFFGKLVPRFGLRLARVWYWCEALKLVGSMLPSRMLKWLAVGNFVSWLLRR
jgi:hypothetical protein